jgi:hypothetical protein
MWWGEQGSSFEGSLGCDQRRASGEEGEDGEARRCPQEEPVYE